MAGNYPSSKLNTDLRFRAKRLLKSVKASETLALKRISEAGFRNADEFRYKHALDIVAQKEGWSSWVEFAQAYQNEKVSSAAEVGDFFYPRHSGHLNHWFRDYDEALDYHRQSGGFLLPYRRQVFVASAEYIDSRGFDAQDERWRLIKYDWIEPADLQAREDLWQDLKRRC